MATPVAATSASTCCGSGPSPSKPIAAFIEATAGSNLSDDGTPKKFT